MALKLSNLKKYLLIALYIFWLYLSFYIPLALNHGIFFFSAFMDYLIYFQIISTLGFAYFLTNGHLSEAKKYIKQIVVFTAISIVFVFTFFKWTTTASYYEQYGGYLAKGEHLYDFIYNNDGKYSDFERETLYREASAYKYDIVFKQIWTFDAFMFFSTFLLLMVLDKKEHAEK